MSHQCLPTLQSPKPLFFALLFFCSLQLSASLTTNTILFPNPCSSDSDCKHFYAVKCDPTTHQCIHSCINSDCDRFSGAGLGDCNANRCYIKCTSVTDPICQEMRGICDFYGGSTTEMRCQQCQNTGDCTAGGYPGTVRCDKSTTPDNIGICTSCPAGLCPAGSCVNFKCVECTDNTYCQGNNPTKPYCDIQFTGNFCKECLEISHCTSLSKSLCLSSGTCDVCSDHSHCSRFTSTPYCASSGCVQCTDDSHCPSSGTPYCVGNTCQACSTSICSNRFSTSSPTKLACLASSGVCVQCTDDSYCPSTGTPYCNSGSNTCEACSSGLCTTLFLTTNPTKLVCVAATGLCVQCTDDTHCPTTGTPYCETNTCQACSASICSARDPIKLACEASSGVCQECTGDSFCTNSYCEGNNCYGCSFSGSICSSRFPTTKPVCSTSTDVCVECQLDSHCPTITKSYCNPSSATCQPCTQDSHCTHITGKNKCYQGECFTYQEQCSPTYQILITQNSNVFSLKFPSSLISQSSSLTLQLLNIPDQDYTYTLTKTSDPNTYLATFTFQTTIPETTLRLSLPCPPQPGYLYGDIQVNFSTEKVLYTTPEIEKNIETVQNIMSSATTAMTGLSGSLLLTGVNPAILWALIHLLQAFYYLVFINVEYPANVRPFFKLFTMGNLSFIPNPMAWFFPEIEDESLDAPKRFLENDVNGLFLQTAGNLLLTWFLVLMGFIGSVLFLKYTRNMPKIFNVISSKTVEIFQWSGVFRTLITSYTQLTIAALLQARVLNYNSTLFSMSSVLGIVFIVLAGIIPLITWRIIYKYQKDQKTMERRFSTLIEEVNIKSTSSIPKYLAVIFLLRRFVLSISLVFLHDFPYVEIYILILSCVIWLILLCKFQLYESKVNNIANIISEIIFTGVHVVIFVLIHDDNIAWLDDQDRIQLGWGIIGGCGVILIISLLMSLVQQYYALKQFIGFVLKVLKKKDSSNKKRKHRLRRTAPAEIFRTAESLDGVQANVNTDTTRISERNDSISSSDSPLRYKRRLRD